MMTKTTTKKKQKKQNGKSGKKMTTQEDIENTNQTIGAITNMKAGDAIFAVGMILLALFYMKITDYQIEKLDKRITNLEWRVHLVENKLKVAHK